MANSLHDNVLKYFEDPKPFDASWVRALHAGILQNGMNLARENGGRFKDGAGPMWDMLVKLRQTITYVFPPSLEAQQELLAQEILTSIREIEAADLAESDRRQSGETISVDDLREDVAKSVVERIGTLQAESVTASLDDVLAGMQQQIDPPSGAMGR